MAPPGIARLRRHLPLLAALGLAAALLFPNLGNIHLWQDEAETALLARNVLVYGVPRAFDGRNVITQNQEREFGEDYVWTWSPWLQFYVAAASFAVLGESTLSARLPFALLGLGAVGLLYAYAGAATGSRRVALLAALLMATSVPFLLHARQCRWYMGAVLATVWLLHAYLQLRRGRRSGAPQLAAAGALLFYSNYLVLAYVLGGVVLHAAGAWLRGWGGAARRPDLWRLSAALAVLVLVAAPWAVCAEIWSRPNPDETYALGLLERMGVILAACASSLNRYLLPLPLLLALPFAVRALRREAPRALGEVGAVGVVGEVGLWLAVGLCAFAFLALLPWTYFRYLLGLLPVAALLSAVVLDRLFAVHAAVGAAAMAVLVGSNALSLALPPHRLESDAWRYLQELRHDYDGPNEALVEHLLAHGRRDQLVLTNYGQLPITFYTGMRAVGFGQDPRIPETPDWIVIRRGRPHMTYLSERARAGGYRPIVLDAPDLLWGNRPDPAHHRFRSVTDAPKLLLLERP